MKEIIDDILIITYEKGCYDHSLLMVARKLNGGQIEILKTFQQDEADDVYKQLIGDKE